MIYHDKRELEPRYYQTLVQMMQSQAYRELAAIRQASCTTHSVIVVRPTPAAG